MPTYAGGSPWKSSLRDSVSNMAFSNFKVSVSTVLLSLSPTPSHSQTKALSLSHKPTHSHRVSLTHATVARPLTLTASPTPSSLVVSLSQPHTHTLSVSHKPEHSYCVSLTHAIACPTTLSASPMPWSPSICALKSFSLWKPKKKRWVPCESFFFFFFWFLFWISNRTVKKDWSFIVFWVRIVFLGLFIFWVCLGFRVLSFGFRWLFRC